MSTRSMPQTFDPPPRTPSNGPCFSCLFASVPAAPATRRRVPPPHGQLYPMPSAQAKRPPWTTLLGSNLSSPVY